MGYGRRRVTYCRSLATLWCGAGFKDRRQGLKREIVMSNSVQTIRLHPRIPARGQLSRNLVFAFVVGCALLWIAAWVSVSAPMVAAMQHLRSNAARVHGARSGNDAARVYLLSRTAPAERVPSFCSASPVTRKMFQSSIGTAPSDR